MNAYVERVTRKIANATGMSERAVAVTFSVLVGGCLVLRAGLRHQQKPKVADFSHLEKDVVHLFALPRMTSGPNLSSPCIKVEAFLRLAKIPYHIHLAWDFSQSPTGRIPFIVHNGHVVTDSEFIIAYLTDTFAVRMDKDLSPGDRAKGHLVRRMIETSFNYGFKRSITVDNTEVMLKFITEGFQLDPATAEARITGMRSRSILMLNATGYGDLTKEQYEAAYLEDAKCLETLITKGGLLFGRKPTSFDCVVYAWLSVAILLGPVGPAQTFIHESTILRDYVKRMASLVYPEKNGVFTTESVQKFP